MKQKISRGNRRKHMVNLCLSAWDYTHGISKKKKKKHLNHLKVMIGQNMRRRKSRGHLKREDEDILMFTGTRINKRKPEKFKIEGTRWE